VLGNVSCDVVKKLRLGQKEKQWSGKDWVIIESLFRISFFIIEGFSWSWVFKCRIDKGAVFAKAPSSEKRGAGNSR
jgi:hypothetical protein